MPDLEKRTSWYPSLMTLEESATLELTNSSASSRPGSSLDVTDLQHYGRSSGVVGASSSNPPHASPPHVIDVEQGSSITEIVPITIVFP
ncbi:hypothetical protein DEO72_LG7g631 [Vigna unguiculata]|uniref:Uncharacterized protein n=1 Tax=Vigna unguiculata TaxID=3917 RepID=A0A4D6MF32_VIGUN|nr:hypothetical protein DEO72_LG7g631 [Vigna unguiculata]